jgi:hypothetical protein
VPETGTWFAKLPQVRVVPLEATRVLGMPLR